MVLHLQISGTAFDKWKLQHVGKIGRHRYWTIAQVISYRVAREQLKYQARLDDMIQAGSDGDDLNPVIEKAKLDREKRIGQELANDEKMGNVFPTAAAGFVWAKAGAEMSAVLESLPAKLKRSMPKMTATQLNVIKKEIAKACNTAADVADKFDEFLEEYYT